MSDLQKVAAAIVMAGEYAIPIYFRRWNVCVAASHAAAFAFRANGFRARVVFCHVLAKTQSHYLSIGMPPSTFAVFLRERGEAVTVEETAAPPGEAFLHAVTIGRDERGTRIMLDLTCRQAGRLEFDRSLAVPMDSDELPTVMLEGTRVEYIPHREPDVCRGLYELGTPSFYDDVCTLTRVALRADLDSHRFAAYCAGIERIELRSSDITRRVVSLAFETPDD